jgi:hypothetical protein
MAPETQMSDSRKYLLGATATIVAARIAARSGQPAPAPSLKDEFAATYRELEEALAVLGEGDKPRKRENENLMGD